MKCAEDEDQNRQNRGKTKEFGAPGTVRRFFLPSAADLFFLDDTLTNVGNNNDKPTRARIPMMIGVRSGKAASSAPYDGAGSPYEAAGSP